MNVIEIVQRHMILGTLGIEPGTLSAGKLSCKNPHPLITLESGRTTTAES